MKLIRMTPTLLMMLAMLLAGIAPETVEPDSVAAQPSNPLAFFSAASSGIYSLYAPGVVLTAYSRGFQFALPGGDSDDRIRVSFAGADPAAVLEPEGRLTGTFSDLRGEPGNWRSAQPTFSGLRWRGLWEGADLVLEVGNPSVNTLPVRWRIEPPLNAKVIEGHLQIEGANSASLSQMGLSMETSSGAFVLSLPKDAAAKARLSPLNGGGYRLSFPLRTGLTSWLKGKVSQQEPAVLQYSSYLGGSAWDLVTSVAVDSSGAVYAAGQTASADFPASTLTGSAQGMPDAFLVKLAPDGSRMEYAVLLGGGGDDTISALAVENGIAYVTGDTISQQFPSGAQPKGENDAWAAAITPDGGGFVYSTRIGGSDQDRAFGLAVKNGAVTLTGVTWSADFPSTGFAGNGDVFVVQLNPQGQVVRTALFGGSDVDAGFDVAVSGGQTVVCGQTWSRSFTLPGYKSNGDAFVLLLDDQLAQSGGAVIGGAGDDSASACAFAPDGRIYAAGRTSSSDFPATGGAFHGSKDAFILQLSASGALENAVLFGGKDNDEAAALAFDADGSLWAAGSTSSADFPTGAESFTAGSLGGKDAFALKVSDADLGNEPVFISRIGGSGSDEALDLAVSPFGTIYIVGATGSTDFPLSADALDRQLAGYNDGFVTWFSLGASEIAPTATTQPPVPTATQGPALVLETLPAETPTRSGAKATETSLPEDTASPENAGPTSTQVLSLPLVSSGGTTSAQPADSTPEPVDGVLPDRPVVPLSILLAGAGGLVVIGLLVGFALYRRRK